MTVYRQNTNVEKMHTYVYAKRAKFLAFSHSKTAISFNILSAFYNRYFVGTNGMLVGLHVPTNFQNIPTNTNIKQMYVYASERSERA